MVRTNLPWQAAGLVATQAIRAGSNRKVLDAIVADTRIFNAWSDETWINEGAAVRVSLIGFASVTDTIRQAWLDGKPASTIHADLTAGEGLNLTQISSLYENFHVAFKGAEKSGAFELPGTEVRSWLSLPNPNGRPNSDVLKPWINGQDIAKRPSDTWIIDFGVDMSLQVASLYEHPFEHVLLHVKPERDKNNDRGRRENWWRFGRNGADMRQACVGLSRVIVTPRVAKHRYFVWISGMASPDSRLCVIARSDDLSFGLLSSRQHLIWAFANASMHGIGNDPTYNTASCFETFPFPSGLTPRDTAPVNPAQTGSLDAAERNPGALRHESPDSAELHPGYACTNAEAIAAAAKRLNQLRENWLNPPEWVDWVITSEEEKAGFPKRPVAKPGHEAELKKRTLTNLYNAKLAGKAAWLDMAHKQLDQSVAAAYGWTDYTPEMPDEEILRRLLALNLERAACPATT